MARIRARSRSSRISSFSKGGQIIDLTQVIAHKDDEIKESHLKRLFELSKKSLGEIPHLEEPSEEQLHWVKRRMRDSARSWVWER